MKEAKELWALIEDVAPQTFARFGHYIYTGTYHAAEHHVLLDADVIGEDTITHNPNEDCCDAAPDIDDRNALEDSLLPREGAVAEPEDPFFAVSSAKKKKKLGKKGFQSIWDAPPSPPPQEVEEPPYLKRPTHHPSPNLDYPDKRRWEGFTALGTHAPKHGTALLC